MSKSLTLSKDAVKGFTLIEVITVVAIATILATIATPSLSKMVDNQHTKITASDIYTSMLRARSEAIKRNTPVTVTPKTSGDWASGWTIPNPAYADTLIEDHAAVTDLTVTGPDSIVYQSSGRVRGNATPSFQISGSDSSPPRCVIVDLDGTPQIKQGSC
jgi:type IV fimbrial biogenesis protein FimT